MTKELRNKEELQVEFKTILGKVDPYFNKLKSLEKLLCREWLHKLLKTGKHEESLRNAYLIKLYEQLEKGKLNEPFDNLPKHKLPLLPLTKHNLSKQHIYVEKTVQTKEDSLITDMVNVHETIDAQKHTKNQEHTDAVRVNERSDDGKRLDLKDISDDSKEVQQRIQTLDKSEGDGLTLNEETKLKLESFEKVSNELKKKSELLTEQIQAIELYADKNIVNNDTIVLINATLNEYKNDMENQRNQEAVLELDLSKSLKIILDKTIELNNRIVSEMNHLKGIFEDACVTKKSMNFFTEQLKEQHRLNINKTEELHTEATRKLQDEISQLKEYVSKVEERAMYQQYSNECYEDEYSSA